jgi:hypothetical protein
MREPTKIYEQIRISSGFHSWSDTAEIDTGSAYSYLCQAIISRPELKATGEYWSGVGGASQMGPSHDCRFQVEISSTVSDKGTFTVTSVLRGQSIGNALLCMNWLKRANPDVD